MNQQTILKIINPILFLAFLVQMTTIVLMNVLPETSWVYEIHEIAGSTLITLVIVHLILNRIWIKNAFFAKKRK